MTALPSGWIFVADFGIRKMPMAAGVMNASVGVGQDQLGSISDLAGYIEKQQKLIAGCLTDVKFAGPQSMSFPSADEACLIFARHNGTPAGNVLHAQTYVRQGDWIGIITLTTLEAQLGDVRADYDAFVKGLRIHA